MHSSTLPSTSALDGYWLLTPRPGRFTPGKETVPIAQEAGWAPGLVWTGADNLAPSEIRSPERPVCSESLYRLSYGSVCAIILAISQHLYYATEGSPVNLIRDVEPEISGAE